MPLLLRGLDLPEPEIRASIIDTLHSSAAGGSQQPIVAEHAPTLIAAMLTNSRAATMPSSVRLCLSHVFCG
jgi:DNA repair/transcription protein MET18/MMS19